MYDKAKIKIKVSVILAAIALFAGYGLFQARYLIMGPVINLYKPLSGLTESPIAAVAGRARNVSYIDLDGRQIYIDETGEFNEKLLLSRGYNIIKLSARDKFGRTVEKTVELVLDQK